uniref:Uncharacterized protein n=1 Tax=viral metagenome TaxID=1070528 RepID=A0A6C0DT98_9ZZZZ
MAESIAKTILRASPSPASLFQMVLIGMLASVTFGTIDALNFLLIEGPMEAFWRKTGLLDEKTIPLVNGGTAAAISIFLALYIEEYLHARYAMFKHPAIDAVGIILGTCLVILGYKLYLRHKAKKAAAAAAATNA